MWYLYQRRRSGRECQPMLLWLLDQKATILVHIYSCLTKWSFKIVSDCLAVFSNSAHSVKALHMRNKKTKKKKNKMEKWACFTICEKSWNSILFLLIIAGHLISTKGCNKRFSLQYKSIRLAFKAWLVCIPLGVFPKFMVDSYYEPLVWFMLVVHNSCH